MRILVLTQNNCRYCEMTKAYLNDQEVEFDVINTSNEPSYIEKYDMMGAPTVLLLDDEEVIIKSTGFNPEDLETMIEQL
jgi:glutaredoxin